MATTKLGLYNQALGHLKVSALANLTEDVPHRYVLDTYYDNCLKILLEAGFWKFAIRSVKIEKDASIVPAFGLSNAFNKPDDWVKTYFISGSEFLDIPLDGWIEEANCFFADIEPIYLRYVSNGATGYGMDLSRWTGKFEEAVTYKLAAMAAPKASGSSDSLTGDMLKLAESKLQQALGFEALREPPRRPPEGHWNNARRGWGGHPTRYPGGWQF